MTPEQFAYWLQGFAEIHGGAPTEQQWQVVKDHLNLVFNKVTPNRQPYCAPNAPIPNPFPSFPYSDGPICGGEPFWRVPQPGEPGEIVYCEPQTTTAAPNGDALTTRNICSHIGGNLDCWHQGGVVPQNSGKEPTASITTLENMVSQKIYDEIVKQQRPGGLLRGGENVLSSAPPPISC